MPPRSLKLILADLVFLPAVFLAGTLLAFIKRRGLWKLPLCRSALWRAGVHPILDHYYEPLFHPRHLLRPLDAPRALPGIDWNKTGQLELLAGMRNYPELLKIPWEKSEGDGFYYQNDNFSGGDADMLYHMIRHFRPARIIEVGSGFSTRMAARAIADEQTADPAYRCAQICIEPYEMPWLERLGATVIPQRVETLDLAIFDQLAVNDLLFIDSSHVLRPQGDVTHLVLEVLPRLQPGVLVHVHDIFSPRDYPAQWVVEMSRMWTEQYLLEAFLTENAQWEVLLALDHLWHEAPAALAARCPSMPGASGGCGSFYLRRKAPRPAA